MDWLGVALENLIKAKEEGGLSEADTKRLIIEPLLAWIGYEPWKYGGVWEEYSVEAGTQKERPDYALVDGENTYMLLEAKALGQRLREHAEKVATYCYHERVRFGLLTDGERWILVDSEWKGRNRAVLELRVGERIVFKDKEVKGYEALRLFHPSRKAALLRLVRKAEEVLEKGLEPQDAEAVIHRYLVEAVGSAAEPARAQDSPGSTRTGKVPNWFALFEAYVRGEISQRDFSQRIKGPIPKEICIGRRRVRVTSWKSILREVVEWLISQGKITGPLKVPGQKAKLYLVNTVKKNPSSRVHPDEGFDSEPLSNDMWLWTNFNRSRVLVIVADLLKQFGYDPLEVVRVSC